MVMRLLPQVAQDPQRSQAGQIQASVTPMRDVTGSQIADVGEGAVRIGRELTSGADLYQDQLDLAKSAEAENRLRDVMREELEAPATGYFTTVGQDAVGERRKKAFDRMTQERQKIEAGLVNNAQKANFRDQADRMLADATTLADRHQQEQVVNYRFGQLAARSRNSLGDAAKLVGTDEGELAKMSALRDIEDQGQLAGWAPERVQLEKMQATTALHETVVRGMVRSGAAGSGSAAAGYLDRYAKEVSPDRLDDLRELSRTATANDWAASTSDAAQRQATEEFSKEFMAREGAVAPTAADIESSWQRAAEIIRRDDKLPVEVRDKALARLDADYQRVKVNEARTGNAVMDDATAWLLQNPLASPGTMPAEIEQAVDAAGVRGELNAWANSGKRYVSDPVVEANLSAVTSEQLRKTTPDELVRKFRGKLDNESLNLLLSRQRQAMGAASKNDTVAISQRERIEESFYELTGKNRSVALDNLGSKEFVAFRKKVQARIDLEPRDSELAPKRLQEILDETAMDKVQIDSFLMDSEKSSYLVSDGDRASAYVTIPGGRQVYVKEIPDTERTRISMKLVARGRKVTEAEIARLWVLDGEPK